MRCTFFMLELEGLLESNSCPVWPDNDPWYGYSAAQCLQSEREALEGFLAWHHSWHLGRVRSLVFFILFIYLFLWICVCVFQFVGMCAFYAEVGFFIMPGGHGFGKANLGLRALGPCQAHQPISQTVRYRIATACIHTCTNMQHPHSLPWDLSYDTLYIGTIHPSIQGLMNL